MCVSVRVYLWVFRSIANKEASAVAEVDMLAMKACTHLAVLLHAPIVRSGGFVSMGFHTHVLKANTTLTVLVPLAHWEQRAETVESSIAMLVRMDWEEQSAYHAFLARTQMLGT
jgi:hypothetical protein